MRDYNKIYLPLLLVVSLLSPDLIGQDQTVKVGTRDIIKSMILNEEREILVHLPDSYYKSDKSFPVLYRLDGDVNLMIETLATVNRLTYSDEIIPEMIIVAVKNTRRDKDMWPVNTRYYPEPEVPGAASFLCFIGEELLPYIDSKYRTSSERIIVGQSLSSVFVLYTFLEQPGLFDSYVAISGAFPGCEVYFRNLAEESLLQKNRFTGQRLFISNGLKDPLDPDGELHQQMVVFTEFLTRELEGSISLQYWPYKGEGHVPFHSLHDALRFIYQLVKYY
jgi:predicted alpha/beta superfamily hydrolase